MWVVHPRNFDKQFFRQAKSILPFDWMIWVKYNRRYHFLDEDHMLNSDNKQFVNDLQTRAETQIFPHKHKVVHMLKQGLQATASIFFPFLVAYDQASVKEMEFVGEFVRWSKTWNMIAFIDGHVTF